jgi:anti-anti-sigma regulatory factor
VPDLPSSAVTVAWADDAVIVAVHGRLDPVASSQALERITLVIGDGPRRLVLNLADVGDRFPAECLALIAVTRHLLPPGCVLDVCSASPAVHRILALTGWSRPDPAARPCRVLRPGGSQCLILGLPLEAVPCAGPVRLGGTGSSRGQVPDPRNRRGPPRHRPTCPPRED